MKRVALVTGLTNQDGLYIAEPLGKKDYSVQGIKNVVSRASTDRIGQPYQVPAHVGTQLHLALRRHD